MNILKCSLHHFWTVSNSEFIVDWITPRCFVSLPSQLEWTRQLVKQKMTDYKTTNVILSICGQECVKVKRTQADFILNEPSPSLTLISTHLQVHSHMDYDFNQREGLFVKMTEACNSSELQISCLILLLCLIFFESHTVRADWGKRSQRVRQPSFTLMCDWHQGYMLTQHTELLNEQSHRGGEVESLLYFTVKMSEQDWCIVQHRVYCSLMGAEGVWSSFILLWYLLV